MNRKPRDQHDRIKVDLTTREWQVLAALVKGTLANWLASYERGWGPLEPELGQS